MANEHGLRALPVEWYFENTPITPVMIREGMITFRVVLPFTDEKICQRYDIQMYVVPMDSLGSREQVMVQRDTAMETASGFWFVPTLCHGYRPQLCRAGPRWRDAYPCECGLITGHAPDRKLCEITITNNNSTTAHELEEGTFILQTCGEDLR